MSQLLLAGGGHTHALLLRRWAMHPSSRPAAEAITLVSAGSTSLYSGLIPAALQGALPIDDCAIDLRELCRRAAVGFVQARISGLDVQSRELRLEGDRPALRFDWLSLNLGATVHCPDQAGCLPIKPLEPVLKALAKLSPGDRVRVIGSGAAAVEVSLALAARGLMVQLVARERQRSFWGRFEAVLRAVSVQIVQEPQGSVRLELHCTGSRGHHWLASAGLPVDGHGRVLTQSTLRSLGNERIFAMGDCAVVANQPRPASGVWAVRAAPLLARNLKRALGSKSLRSWHPQRRALQLLGDGRSRAWALWGTWGIGPSRWLWHWKQRLDQRFMAMLHPAAMTPAEPMLCCGCAAKLPEQPLMAALSRLQGGRPPLAEDAASFATPGQLDPWWQSVDGFPALVADPWLNGRLTALHACSDLWACGVPVAHAQALVTMPQAASNQQEELLLQTLAGVRSVLEPQGAALIGGHTLQSREPADLLRPLSVQLSLALVINGRQHESQTTWGKGPLHAGDALLLTRGIGSGVLFAAAMAGAAAPGWIEAALTQMQRSQAPLLPVLRQHGCHACTDITGFGLLGHLNEMLEASAAGLQVVLDAEAVPAFSGALELLAQGWRSSLAPANGGALQRWPRLQGVRAELLVDPQTCGPLLVALPQEQAGACVQSLERLGWLDATVIGRVQQEGG